MDDKIEATIVILTKNAAGNIAETLAMIQNQEPKCKIEIIVIDSGSTDRTIDILKTFADVKLIQQNAKDFHHGRTRNLGGAMAHGNFIVFLNGDAVPANDSWLANLLKNLQSDKDICAVYSRHIPKPDCHLYMAIELSRGMQPIKKIKSLKNCRDGDYPAHIYDLIQFSTVSCAVKKDLWDANKFNENIPMAEDQDWARQMLLKGYAIIYEPASVIIHSHNYTFKQFLKYHGDNRRSFNIITGQKKSLVFFLQQFLTFPFHIAKEMLTVINCARVKQYPLSKILHESLVAFLLRLAALTGEFIGNY